MASLLVDKYLNKWLRTYEILLVKQDSRNCEMEVEGANGELKASVEQATALVSTKIQGQILRF